LKKYLLLGVGSPPPPVTAVLDNPKPSRFAEPIVVKKGIYKIRG
jgi:hypothetical protein